MIKSDNSSSEPHRHTFKSILACCTRERLVWEGVVREGVAVKWCLVVVVEVLEDDVGQVGLMVLFGFVVNAGSFDFVVAEVVDIVVVLRFVVAVGFVDVVDEGIPLVVLMFVAMDGFVVQSDVISVAC